MPVEARVDVAGGRVDQQPQPAEAGLALEARHEVVGQRDPLQRRAQHELARVEDERLVAGDRRRARSGRPTGWRTSMNGGGCCGTPGTRRRRARRPTTAAAAPRRRGRSRGARRRAPRGSFGRRGPRWRPSVPAVRYRGRRGSSSARFRVEAARRPAPRRGGRAGRAGRRPRPRRHPRRRRLVGDGPARARSSRWTSPPGELAQLCDRRRLPRWVIGQEPPLRRLRRRPRR